MSDRIHLDGPAGPPPAKLPRIRPGRVPTRVQAVQVVRCRRDQFVASCRIAARAANSDSPKGRAQLLRRARAAIDLSVRAEELLKSFICWSCQGAFVDRYARLDGTLYVLKADGTLIEAPGGTFHDFDAPPPLTEALGPTPN